MENVAYRAWYMYSGPRSLGDEPSHWRPFPFPYWEASEGPEDELRRRVEGSDFFHRQGSNLETLVVPKTEPPRPKWDDVNFA